MQKEKFLKGLRIHIKYPYLHTCTRTKFIQWRESFDFENTQKFWTLNLNFLLFLLECGSSNIFQFESNLLTIWNYWILQFGQLIDALNSWFTRKHICLFLRDLLVVVTQTFTILFYSFQNNNVICLESKKKKKNE